MIAVTLMMAAAAGVEPVTLQTADYAQRYTRAEWLSAYPAKAKEARLSGKASLLCHVAQSGWLIECKVESEEPVGHAFGEALIKIAQRNQLKPEAARIYGYESWVRYEGRFDQFNLAGPAVDQPPTWLKQPAASQITAVWPRKAMEAGLSGKAGISCRVTVSGSLDQCVVREESPVDQGFGDAALLLAPAFEMKPAMKDGKPVASSVNIPVNFTNSGPSVDQAPDWLRRPTASQLNAVWPQKALEAGIGGTAVIACRVTVSGALDQCVITEESPAGQGFGAAALLLAPAFQMKPAIRDGKPVASSVRIPINFTGRGNAGTLVLGTAAKVLSKAPFDRAPSYAELIAAWPKDVPESAADAKAAMRCRLRLTGAIEDCTFTFATSPSFERASRELAKRFHVIVGPEVSQKDISNTYVAVAIQFVSPARANPARSIARAEWVKGPDTEVYPSEAAQQGVKIGRATATCIVGADGGMTDCRTASETPEKLGFGAAAVQMASTMRMILWGEDGLPTAGASVRLPFQINQPEAEVMAK